MSFFLRSQNQNHCSTTDSHLKIIPNLPSRCERLCAPITLCRLRCWLDIHYSLQQFVLLVWYSRFTLQFPELSLPYLSNLYVQDIYCVHGETKGNNWNNTSIINHGKLKTHLPITFSEDMTWEVVYYAKLWSQTGK